MKFWYLPVLLLIFAIHPNESQAVLLKMECVPSNVNFCTYVKTEFEKKTAHKLDIVVFPDPTDERLKIFQNIFNAHDSKSIDVFQADLIWMGLFQKHFLDLTEATASLKDKFFPSSWNHNIFNGKTKGIPAFLDAGMLYYRKDLLEKYHENVPNNWDELYRIAKKIQDGERAAGHAGMWGYIFQGKNYEGLYCNALEWFQSNLAGTIIDKDGNISIKLPESVAALDMASHWIGTITPHEVLSFMEEESRLFFQNGNAVFMRNWPYAYILAQADNSAVKGDVGVAPLPKAPNGIHASALGGWQWAINKYTDHPEASIELIKFLVEPETQKAQFRIGGVAPSRMDVYDDNEVNVLAPHLSSYKVVFFSAVPRASNETKSKYPVVSRMISDAVYDVLTGRLNSREAMIQLGKKLEREKGKHW